MTKTKSSKSSVGKIALDLQKKSDLQTDSIELQREIHKGSNSDKSYEEEVWTTVERGRDDTSIHGDFYIIVISKKERLLQNIVRQYFFYRQSCPTPEFDQTVYKFIREDDHVDFLWTVPNNVACLNLPLRKKDLPADQMMLVSMIDAFHCGDLDRLAAKHNKEEFSTQ